MKLHFISVYYINLEMFVFIHYYLAKSNSNSNNRNSFMDSIANVPIIFIYNLTNSFLLVLSNSTTETAACMCEWQRITSATTAAINLVYTDNRYKCKIANLVKHGNLNLKN